MKTKLAVDSIKPGTRYTKDVFSDEETLIVPAGIEIRQKDIDGLKQWKVKYIYTDGVEQIDEPVKDDTENLDIDEKVGLSIVNDKEIQDLYFDLVSKMKSVMDSITVNEIVEPKRIDDLARIIIDTVRDNPSSVTSVVLSNDLQAYNLARSAVNCSILSVMVGIILKIPAYRLTYLAEGALLHDVGMLRVPPDIVEKKQKLSLDEIQKMQGHALLSYRIIVKELHYPEEVGLVAVQHHESWNGEGYPRKLAGQDIDILSRIVSVADAFEAMISEKPYRDSLIGYSAIKNLLSDNSRRFDPDVLKAFIKSMGLYPIGSIVVLNNAAIARVENTSSGVPLRPKVRIIVDEFGKHYKNSTGEVVDLLSEKSLFIARALNPKELNV